MAKTVEWYSRALMLRPNDRETRDKIEKFDSI